MDLTRTGVVVLVQVVPLAGRAKVMGLIVDLVVVAEIYSRTYDEEAC